MINRQVSTLGGLRSIFIYQRPRNPIILVLQPKIWIALFSITFKIYGVMSYHLLVTQTLQCSGPSPCLVLWFYSVEPVTLRCIERLENFTPLNLICGILKIAFCCLCFPAIITSPQTLLNLWQGFKITPARSAVAFYCWVRGAYWGGNEHAKIWQSFGANRIVLFCILFLIAVSSHGN